MDENIRAPDESRWETLIYDEYADDPEINQALIESRELYLRQENFQNRINQLKFENERKICNRIKELKNIETQAKIEKDIEMTNRKNQVKEILEIVRNLCRIEPKEKYMCNNILRDFNNYIINNEYISEYVYYILHDDMEISPKKLEKIIDIFIQEDTEYTYEEDI